MGIDMERFFQVFFDEAAELLATLENLLLALDGQTPDEEQLNAIFRIAHSIKGGAGTFGFDELIDIAHVMESMLDRIRHGDAAWTPRHRDVFLQAKDVLKMQVDGLRTGAEVDAAQVAELRTLLTGMADAPQPVPGPLRRDAGVALPALVAQAAAVERHALAEPDAASHATVAGDPAALALRIHAAKPDAGAVDASTIRVNIEKVDQLINLVGELVITQAMLVQHAQVLEAARHEAFLRDISQLSRNTRELQEAVMSIRMMPMDFVFSRFPRMVHELSGKLGKAIDFVTDGQSTELDKGLIEKIVDPLTHLVRNSIDHGIETPSERLRCGKSETGQLRLSAAHQGGHIVLEVRDDGAGLNRERILAKARAQGCAIDSSASDEAVWQLIFRPGFSTADVVTDVSGRGVGMDVVKRTISALGGTVSVSSKAGQGTSTRISLPLTMAILDGMSVRVGGETYMLPLSNVVESFQPLAQDVRGMNSQGSVVHVRGEYLPIISLAETFGAQARSPDPTSGILVVIAAHGRQAALWVDELVGQQQVVVKNIERNYRKVPNVSGATILGDGSVSLIVDIGAVLGAG